MIFRRNRKMNAVIVFGCWVLTLFATAGINAKQADSDHFTIESKNLNAFAINVFGQGFYDVSFSLTGESNFRLTAAELSTSTISVGNTFDSQTGLLTLPRVNIKSGGSVVTNYYVELELEDPENLVFGIVQLVEAEAPPGVSRRQVCTGDGCFELFTKLDGLNDGSIRDDGSASIRVISWDPEEVAKIVTPNVELASSEIQKAGHNAALSTVVVYGDWCMDQSNASQNSEPIFHLTMPESGFFVSDSLVLTSLNALRDMDYHAEAGTFDVNGGISVPPDFWGPNACTKFGEQIFGGGGQNPLESGAGPIVQLFDGRWALGEVVWRDEAIGLGAVRLVSVTNNRKQAFSSWTPWKAGLSNQHWLSLEPTSFSNLGQTATVHSPELARHEGGWFVSLGNASNCAINETSSRLYLNHYSDIGSNGGPIVNEAGSVVSIVESRTNDRNGVFCAANKTSTTKNSLGPLSRYYADSSNVTVGIPITLAIIDALREIEPALPENPSMSSGAPVQRPAVALGAVQRFEIRIPSDQFTVSGFPVDKLDSSAIGIAKQATVAFTRETGCVACSENKLSSNFDIPCICTGFAVTETLIVTNDHCVTELMIGAKTTFRTFYGQDVEAELIGKTSLDGETELNALYKEKFGDAANGATQVDFHRGDVALLRTAQSMLSVQPLKISDSALLEPWQPLITVGHPSVMTRTGPWVTGVGSFVGADYFDRTSQAYNLPAQKGASGSAVVNLDGELVGQIAYGGIASQTEKTTLLPKKYNLFAVELLVDSVGLRPAPYSDIEAIPVSLAVSRGAPSNYIKEMIEKWAPGELPE